MKMFRVSLAAILSAVALSDIVSFLNSEDVQPPEAVANATTAAHTELAAAEEARHAALQHANQTLYNIMRSSQNYSQQDDDEHLIDEEVASIESAVPNTTEHWSRQRKRLMHERRHEMRQSAHDEARTAETAANAYKHAARVLETQRRHAGLHESVYEGGFDQDEMLSEGWHDEAEDHGDAAKDHINTFFDHVEDKLEHDADQQSQHESQQQSRENDHEWSIYDHSDWEAYHQAHQQSDQQSDQQSATQQVNNSVDQQSNATDVAPLNLRAAAPNVANDTQGFLLTFGCVGFLLSMAFAVQMGTRPATSQASEPLLVA